VERGKMLNCTVLYVARQITVLVNAKRLIGQLTRRNAKGWQKRKPGLIPSNIRIFPTRF
jgi:hypothetical protein